ncbi:uncharacterized protein LOC141696539 [Apium graveolens]|uniref:uncharacterized protein LOC141696539 n=1 Tax=Apium graveolens TaxID=4045 RepID=UPI003D7ABFE2
MSGNEEDKDLINITINAAKRWSLDEDAQQASFEALFRRTDESGRTPLELAMYHNHVKTVELILREDPAYQNGQGSKNHGLLRLINQATDKKYNKNIVQLLSKTFHAGKPDLKDVLALIIAIQTRDTDSISKLLEKDNKDFLSFVDSQGWTPLHYAAHHEFDSILSVLIEAQEKVGNQFAFVDRVTTPFHVAAKCGFTSTVIRLLQLWSAPPSPDTTVDKHGQNIMQVRPASLSPYTAIDENGRNILHLAALQNKKEMVNGILRYCSSSYKKQLLSQKDIDGNTPLHLLVSRGCFIEKLIQYIAPDTSTNSQNWTPRDMLYFQHEIVGEQVQIKMAINDFNADPSRKLLSGSTQTKNTFSSLVLTSRREKKDIIFNEGQKLLMDVKNAKMEDNLQRYREGTNSQIVVSALITTITFTVGFTMPGGLRQSGGTNEGLTVLSKKAAFKIFMISDALALLLSICSLFIYFLENMSQDLQQVTRLHATTVGLNIASVMLTMFVFMTGTYVVLSQSLALAITICLIGSLFFVFSAVQLLRILYDRRVRKNKDHAHEA